VKGRGSEFICGDSQVITLPYGYESKLISLPLVKVYGYNRIIITKCSFFRLYLKTIPSPSHIVHSLVGDNL